MTDVLLYSSAPVLTVDGRRSGVLARDLVHLEVEETTAGLKTLCARFLAHGPRDGRAAEGALYLDGEVFDFGSELAVALGSTDEERTVFRGWISALEVEIVEGSEPEVVVRAEDELMALRTTRRMRTWEEVSDADLAEAIAGEHGLAVETAAEGPTYDVVQQWNQSDLAFLRERARRIRAELWIADGTLHFATRDHRPGTELTLVQGGNLIAVQASADLAHQRTGVHVLGYDASDRSDVLGEGEPEAIDAEVGGGRTGPSVLQRAFGERTSYRTREVPLNEGEARDWARAELLRRARGFVQVRGTTLGTPDLVVGSRLRLERVGAPFDGGEYYATRVQHTYDLVSGHRTSFEAERATVEGPA